MVRGSNLNCTKIRLERDHNGGGHFYCMGRLVVERLVKERLVMERLVKERLVMEHLVMERLLIKHLLTRRFFVHQSL